MTSVGGILSIARTALDASQMGIQVASHNIANASTVGYTREQVNETANSPQLLPFGSLGTGVSADNITRIRDAFLDTTYRTASTAAGSADTTQSTLSQIQSVFGEPSTTGLASTLSAFWSSWSELATDPTNPAAQSVVQEQGQQVAQTLNSFASQITSIDTTTQAALTQGVTTVNNLLSAIASYNSQIVSAQSGGRSPANDLLDARDEAMDQLSTLVNFQSVTRSDGTVGVFIGGNTVVDGNDAQQLTATNGQPASVSIVGMPGTLPNPGGSIGAQLGLLNSTIPQVMTQLNSLAQGLVTQVNAIHSTGATFSGTPPVASPAGNFFAETNPPPAGGDPYETAAGIQLDPAVAANAGAIAASAGTATGPGDNSVANAIANLQTTTATFTSADGATTFGTMSIDDFYQNLVGSVATQVQNSQDNMTVNDTLKSNADSQRQSVSGVSTDEELTAIIQQQSSYTAAARLVTVVDQMMQTLDQMGVT
ncbi:MAG TPA: flagellar hook-associated protein FlgK [Gemmatimonadaceae bacterium]|nr:flagellar hook-associated protein FlgK [Gemmatimonadaceae bacterium]